MQDLGLILEDKLNLVLISILCISIIYVLYIINRDKTIKVLVANSNPKLPSMSISTVNNGINSISQSYIPSVHSSDPSIPNISSDNSSQLPILQSSSTTSSDIRSIIQNNIQATSDNINRVTSGFLGFIYPPKTPENGFVSGSAYGVGNYSILATDNSITKTQLLRLWSDDITLSPFVSSPLFNNPIQSGIINSEYKSLITINTGYIGYEVIITLPESLIITGILFNGPDYRYMPREFMVYGTQKNLLSNSALTGVSTDLVELLNNTTIVKNSLVVYPINNSKPINQIILRIKSIGAANDTTTNINTLQLYTLKLMGYPASMQKNNLQLKSYSSLVMKSPLKIIKQKIPKSDESNLHKALMTASLLFST